MALELEMIVWRQVLAMYHPGLVMPCGPYSRGYRMDMLGHSTHLRMLLAYVGLAPDKSFAQMRREARLPGAAPNEDGTYRWPYPAWLVSNKFHVPADALEEVKHREYPHRFSAAFSWRANGYVDPKTHKYLPVQGKLLPGGQAEIVQVQQPTWALGWRTLARLGHSFPIHLHYALKPRVRSLRDQRSVTAAVDFHGAPEEWVENWRGERQESSNFNNAGPVTVAEEKDGLSFTARPFPEFAGVPADEVSVNSFIPTHFAEVEEITLDGETFTGEPLVKRAKQATLRVQDAGMVYEIEYVFPRAVEIKVYRWAHFVRFAGFWYEGKKKFFTAEELRKMSGRGQLKVVEGG
jgi:hypothetical protein